MIHIQRVHRTYETECVALQGFKYSQFGGRRAKTQEPDTLAFPAPSGELKRRNSPERGKPPEAILGRGIAKKAPKFRIIFYKAIKIEIYKPR
jgi:hypothetical protein